MDTQAIVTFLAASILLTLSPGPDILYVLSTALLQGFKKAWFIALGLCSGLIFHTALVGFGVAQVIQKSEWWLGVFKIFGASYMLYLAYQIFRSSAHLSVKNSIVEQKSLLKFYAKGLLMNVLNPKVSLFFIAFLPQFIQTESENIMGQAIFLGLLFFLQAISIFTITSYFAGYLSRYVVSNTNFQKFIKYFQVILFVGIAVGIFYL